MCTKHKNNRGVNNVAWKTPEVTAYYMEELQEIPLTLLSEFCIFN